MAFLATLSLLAALAVSASTPTPTPASLARGAWGGVGLRVVVSASAVEVDLDAAHGTIEGPLPLDAEGRFEAKGTFVRERPGPTRAGAGDPGEPAQYRGTIHGDDLTLEITLTRSGTAIGPLQAKRGANARLRKMA